jgi:hypothetical protein
MGYVCGCYLIRYIPVPSRQGACQPMFLLGSLPLCPTLLLK